MNNIDKFKDRLKDLRKEYGLTQQEFAEKLGLVRTAVANYENGRNIPNAETLNIIANFFDVTVDYLLGRTGEKNNKSIYIQNSESLSIVNEEKENKLTKEINTLSPENQEEIRKLIELYKLKEMQERNENHNNEINGIG